MARGSWLVARGSCARGSWLRGSWLVLVARGMLVARRQKHVARGSWLVARGSWLVARGSVAGGSWLVARGSWLVARGSWLVARGSWLVAPWLVARGSWLVARGSWLVARGSWLVARGSWLVLTDIQDQGPVRAPGGCPTSWRARVRSDPASSLVTAPFKAEVVDLSQRGDRMRVAGRPREMAGALLRRRAVFETGCSDLLTLAMSRQDGFPH